jgi:transketolase N-terminal domain/subunit
MSQVITYTFHGLGPLACSKTELTSETMNISTGLLGLGIGPLQGICLHRTAQHKKTRTYSHVSSGIQTQDPSIRAVQDPTRGHLDRRVK